MTRPEWDKIIGMMAATWPHSPPPDEAIDKWFLDLQDLDGDQVFVAVETFNREGERYPPTGGRIRARIIELSEDRLDHGEAWRLAKTASIKADPGEAIAWLENRSPEAAETVRQMGGAQLSFERDQESTVRAQFRDIFNSICSRRKREESWAGLPSAGLKALERGPRKIAGVISAQRLQLEKGSPNG